MEINSLKKLAPLILLAFLILSSNTCSGDKECKTFDNVKIESSFTFGQEFNILTISINIPPKFMTYRSIIEFTPLLITDDTIQLNSYTIQGEKVNLKYPKVLFLNGNEIVIHDTVPKINTCDSATIIMKADVFSNNKANRKCTIHKELN